MERNQILTIEMIPKSCWGQNLRKVVSKETWHMLKDKIYYGRVLEDKCMVCSSELPYDWELHEVWKFDRTTKIQHLVDLLALCHDCHMVKHFGLAAKQGKVDDAIKHLRFVNGWSEDQVLQHISAATEEWEKNSTMGYSLNASYAERWIPKNRIHIKWLEEKKGIPSNSYEATEWAKKLLQDNDFLLVDTETTGLLTNKRVEVIELSIVSSKQEIIFDSLIKPKYKIPKRITEYNGISNEKVEIFPTFDEVHEEISKILNGSRLVAFNSKFDQAVLNRTCDLYKLPHFEGQWECALKAYRAYCDFPRSGCHLPMASHSAFEDCLATMRLIFVMANKGSPYDCVRFPAPWLS